MIGFYLKQNQTSKNNHQKKEEKKGAQRILFRNKTKHMFEVREKGWDNIKYYLKGLRSLSAEKSSANEPLTNEGHAAFPQLPA